MGNLPLLIPHWIALNLYIIYKLYNIYLYYIILHIKKLILTFVYQKEKRMEAIPCINYKINIHAETFSNVEWRIRTANPV